MASLAAPVACNQPADLSRCGAGVRQGELLAQWRGNLSDPGGNLATWTGIGPCPGAAAAPWAGIACDEAGTAVAAINVSAFGLSGPIMADWTAFSSLLVGLPASRHDLNQQMPASQQVH